MERIEYKTSYELNTDVKPIDISELGEGDFVHIKGVYSYDGEDKYGNSTGWEDVNYDTVYKIKFNPNAVSNDDYTRDEHIIIFKDKQTLINYIKNNSRVNKTFHRKHIDYTLYKEESVKEVQTPYRYYYHCDTKTYLGGCTGFFNSYENRLVKNDKRISMKIMKDGTHKCYKCCNIGMNLPAVKFHLESNSQVVLDTLLKILRKNSWNVSREDNAVIIGMILRDKVNYVVDMIAELNKKAKFNFKFVKKEKFYNPQRSEIAYIYEMRK